MMLRPTSTLESPMGKVDGVVVVDFSWLLYKSFHSYKQFSVTIDGKEVSTGDIFGVLRTITGLLKIKPFYSVVLCVDSREQGKRKQINPDYKANRSPTLGVYDHASEILTAACAFPGVSACLLDPHESDDLMFSLAHSFSKHFPVYIFSGDNDLLQGLAIDNVHVIRKIAKSIQGGFEYVTREDVDEKFGVTPIQLPIYRSLKGDKSDNLVGIPRIPSKLAAHLAKKYMTIRDLVKVAKSPELWDEFEKKKKLWMGRIVENEQVLLENFAIMKLLPLGRLPIYKSDEASAMTVLKKFHIKSAINAYKEISAICSSR